MRAGEMAPPQQVELRQHFEVPARADCGAKQWVFDSDFRIRRETWFDRYPPRVGETQDHQFCPFFSGSSKRKLGETAFDRGELPLRLRQARQIKTFADKVAAKLAVAAEVCDWDSRVVRLVESRREFGRLNAAGQENRGIWPVRAARSRHPWERSGAISQKEKNGLLFVLGRRHAIWHAACSDKISAGPPLERQCKTCPLRFAKRCESAFEIHPDHGLSSLSFYLLRATDIRFTAASNNKLAARTSACARNDRSLRNQ
jgi:hypothetical protein